MRPDVATGVSRINGDIDTPNGREPVQDSHKKTMYTAAETLLQIYYTRAIFKRGRLNSGERHSRDTQDDGTVTLCALRAATVLSRDCCADFGRPLTKKVMSHSRDGPGVTAPLPSNIVPLTTVWKESPPPFCYPPPLKKSPIHTER